MLTASIVLTALTLYLLDVYDFVLFTGRAKALGQLPNFAYYHLRSSLVFFAAVLGFYALTLRALARRLGAYLSGESSVEARGRLLSRIVNLDTRTDIAIATFFGIGVIYTAIGMETALLTALGGVRDAEEAARQGAWEILRRLVDGGLILALSTTICGGIGGYAMRIVKHAVVGRGLADVVTAEDRKAENALARIADAVADIQGLLRSRRPGDGM